MQTETKSSGFFFFPAHGVEELRRREEGVWLGVYVDTRIKHWRRNSQLARAASWGTGCGVGRSGETRGQAAALGKQPQHSTCPRALAPSWGSRARGAFKSADKEMAAEAAVPHNHKAPLSHTHSCARAGRKPGSGFLRWVVGGTISQETMETLDVF